MTAFDDINGVVSFLDLPIVRSSNNDEFFGITGRPMTGVLLENKGGTSDWIFIDNVSFDGNHIPPHCPKEAGSKSSGPNPKWLVVNRSVWQPIATNSLSLEAWMTNPMYTMELYKSVTVSDKATVIGNAAQQENSEVPNVGEDKSGTDGEEFTEEWSRKWISLENSL